MHTVPAANELDLCSSMRYRIALSDTETDNYDLGEATG